MVIGRVVYGVGGENISVCYSVLITKWFKDKELSLALVINLSSGLLGSSIDSWLSP